MKADAAHKSMNRLSICLRHAAALGPDVDLQATDKAKALLGKQRHKVGNIPSLRWQEVPECEESLQASEARQVEVRPVARLVSEMPFLWLSGLHCLCLRKNCIGQATTQG